jgi:hypothetical protein
VTGVQAVLAGGPEHGRRIEISRPYPRYINLETTEWGLRGLTAPPPPPRPRWWRDPLGWLRWQSPEPWLTRPIPGPLSCVYRHSGFLDDDSPVYWYGGPDITPPADPAEVMRHLLAKANEIPPWERMGGRGHWEMGPEWYGAIRAMPQLAYTEPPSEPAAYSPLLGSPVKITFGSPRYVNRGTP